MQALFSLCYVTASSCHMHGSVQISYPRLNKVQAFRNNMWLGIWCELLCKLPLMGFLITATASFSFPAVPPTAVSVSIWTMQNHPSLTMLQKAPARGDSPPHSGLPAWSHEGSDCWCWLCLQFCPTSLQPSVKHTLKHICLLLLFSERS